MEDFSLVLPEEKVIREEVAVALTPDESDLMELEMSASEYVKKLMAVDILDEKAKSSAVAAVDAMGADLQKLSSRKNGMLQISIKDLAKRGEEGNSVANGLMDLRELVEDLEPKDINFESKGLITKLFNPVKKYFAKYEKAETVLEKIMQNLDNGKDVLRRDNVTLEQDQIDMRDLTKKLEKTVKMGMLMDKKIEEEIKDIEDDNKVRYIKEELLFPLRQRIMDMQQQLMVNQQGIVAIEVVKRNNRELIRGVDRAKYVTVNALKVAIIVAKAQADQKIVLDKIVALNSVTSDIIAATSEKLKLQGAEIHKQASETMLDPEKLKQAFLDIKEAMSEIAKYREQALPRMSSAILEFSKMTVEGEETIQKLERGDRLSINK